VVTLNMEASTAAVVLELVDAEAQRLLAVVATLPPHDRAVAQRRLQHVGVLKHRLEAGLWFENPFPGPRAWGLPRRRAAEPDQPTTDDLFGGP
jgi:hypothetical protein